MAFNFKIFVRALGALIYGAITYHTGLTVELLFGLTAPTVIFILAVFSFYAYLYAYKFQKNYLEQYFDLIFVDEEDFKRIKYGLIVVSVILSLYALWLDPQPLCCKSVGLTVFENLCIAFPEIVVWLLEKPFKKK